MTEVQARVSKSTLAYEWIRQRIGAREFGPGYRLVLGDIAGELGMSVVPVREAIRRLEAEGLVTFEHNVGARVALVDESEYVHTVQTLGIVEGAATGLAAPLLTEAELERAEEVNRRLATLVDDPHRFTLVNQEFHAVLFERCENPDLLDLVHRGWNRLAGLRDSIFGFVPGRTQESVREHDEIIRLIREGATTLEVELAARDHRWRTVNAYLAARHHD
jgi:DNA-binding GntR family transcriptional regulator